MSKFVVIEIDIVECMIRVLRKQIGHRQMTIVAAFNYHCREAIEDDICKNEMIKSRRCIERTQSIIISLSKKLTENASYR